MLIDIYDAFDQHECIRNEINELNFENLSKQNCCTPLDVYVNTT